MAPHADAMSNATRNPVVHFEVLGRDAKALRKFYSEAFGWQLGPADEGPLEYSMVHLKDHGGIHGGIGKAPQRPGHGLAGVGGPRLPRAWPPDPGRAGAPPRSRPPRPGGGAGTGAACSTRLALPAEWTWVHGWFPTHQYSILAIETGAVRTA